MPTLTFPTTTKPDSGGRPVGGSDDHLREDSVHFQQRGGVASPGGKTHGAPRVLQEGVRRVHVSLFASAEPLFVLFCFLQVSVGRVHCLPSQACFAGTRARLL